MFGREKAVDQDLGIKMILGGKSAEIELSGKTYTIKEPSIEQLAQVILDDNLSALVQYLQSEDVLGPDGLKQLQNAEGNQNLKFLISKIVINSAVRERFYQSLSRLSGIEATVISESGLSDVLKIVVALLKVCDVGLIKSFFQESKQILAKA